MNHKVGSGLLAAWLVGCGTEAPTGPTMPGDEAPRPAVAPGEVAPLGAPDDQPPWRLAVKDLTVRRSPSDDADRVGIILAGASFAVRDGAAVAGPGCEGGWEAARGAGWVCGDEVVPTDKAPGWPAATPAPAGATWRGSPDAVNAEPTAMPLLYGRPRSGAVRHDYASAEAMVDGEPADELEPGDALRFHGAQATAQGMALVRRDGDVVALADVSLYRGSPFAGLKLEGLPADGSVPGWATTRDGLAVRSGPAADAPVVWTAPWHAPLRVYEASPGDDRWWRVQAEDGAQGWAPEGPGLRRWIDAPPPSDVGEGVWIDVVLSEQTLALRRGALVLGVTLMSSGTSGNDTPLGVYRLTDKARWWDMRSAPTSEARWDVEGVPWTMHYRPMYAVHGAFWHDDLGRVRSHGCVNLSPADAKLVFDTVGPALPVGWHQVWPTEADPGAVLRVREGNAWEVPDLR
jgi:hypothetical protein